MNLPTLESIPPTNPLASTFSLEQTQNLLVEVGWPREQFDLSNFDNDCFHEQTIELATRLRSARIPVMITGSPGTGKLDVAQTIHEGRDSQVLRLGCNRLGLNQHDEVYSELLAHSKATGTRRKHQVWVLENVDETPFSHQPFLAALVGSILQSTNALGPPILSTTSRRISQMVAREEFRPDLYYQLSTVTVSVPSLSERRKDIPRIIEKLVASERCNGSETIRFTDDALAILMSYKWPGNLFELRNVIAQISILADGPIVDAKRLRRIWRIPVASEPPANLNSMSLEDAETQHILAVMKRCDGNKTAAANQLGISSRTLHNKIQKYRRFGLIE